MMAERNVATLLEQLRTYGDHRWKCDVARQLRADEIVTAKCNCGWDEIAKGLKWPSS